MSNEAGGRKMHDSASLEVARDAAPAHRWAREWLCHFLGHRWTSAYRESDGYPLCRCSRCGLTERWAGGMLIDSTNWRESERLNAKEA